MGGKRGKEAEPSRAEQERVISIAVSVSHLLNQTWPQVTAEAGLHYAIAGSLSVALLAGAGSYTNEDGTEVILPTKVVNRIKSSLHEIHDIDVENRVGPFPHTLTSESDSFLDQVAKLMSSKCARIDDPDSVGVKAPAVAVDTTQGRFYITRFDYQVGFKTLGVFFNSSRKAPQLNREVPLLIECAIQLYGEKYMWDLIGYIFSLHDKLLGRYKRLGLDRSTEYYFESVVSDRLVSKELKEILRKGMARRETL